MLYSLRGTLKFADQSGLAVECGGVAYMCRASYHTISAMGPVGSEAEVFTYLLVRNEALDLFGFADIRELECFKILIGVSGVGPKAALGILSCMTPDKLALSVAAGDYKPVTAAPGVGKKLAERIILELRDKLAGGVLSTPQAETVALAPTASGNVSEAVAALEALGYSRTDAAVAAAQADSGASVEEIIKTALKKLARM